LTTQAKAKAKAISKALSTWGKLIKVNRSCLSRNEKEKLLMGMDNCSSKINIWKVKGLFLLCSQLFRIYLKAKHLKCESQMKLNLTIFSTVHNSVLWKIDTRKLNQKVAIYFLSCPSFISFFFFFYFTCLSLINS
jgi:hypothetical protein